MIILYRELTLYMETNIEDQLFIEGSSLLQLSGYEFLMLHWSNKYPCAAWQKVYAVLDLWENQRGVSDVFLTDFDYFLGVNENLGVERHQRGG